MTIPLPVIANVFRCAFTTHDAATGLNAVNVMHVRAASSGKTPTDVWNCINAHWTGNQQAHEGVSTTVTQFAITPLDGSTATQIFATGGGAKYVGNSSGDTMPAVAALFTIRTLLRGRQNRGRLYLPFVSEGSATNGFLTSGVQGGLQTAWLTFFTGILADATTPLTPGVASYDRAHGGASAHFTPEFSSSVESVLATQRRRQTRLR
jgi:hypothetical protein